jgi:hypothetical protein
VTLTVGTRVGVYSASCSSGRDGRFLVAQRDPQAPPARVNVILNWFDELRAHVPVP